MTSSTKPKVHNVSHCHERTKIQSQATCTENIVMVGSLIGI